MKITAKIISGLFHPLLMPSIGIFLIFNSGLYASFFPQTYKNYLYLFSFIATCVIPILIVLIPYLFNRMNINRIEMEDRKERLAPLFITAICYSMAYYFMGRLTVPPIVNTFMLATLASVICVLIITFFWKISAHMVGLGGLIGAIGAIAFKYSVDLQFMIMVAFIAAGLVGTARLYLNSHKPSQVYSGFILGILVVSLIILLG